MNWVFCYNLLKCANVVKFHFYCNTNTTKKQTLCLFLKENPITEFLNGEVSHYSPDGSR